MMGWGRTLLLGDVGNRLDIEDCERELKHMQRELRGGYRKDMSQDKKIERLQEENAELKLYLASMVRLLMSKGTFERSELEAIVNAIDAEDGKKDGKMTGEIA